MNKVLKHFERNWIYYVAFCIPWILVLVVSIAEDGWPTGSGSVLTGDTLVQLLPYARELWTKVHSGDGLAYTWNAAGGCDFFAILSSYLSPFTLLLLLFPKQHILNILQIVMILKWSCSGVTMVYFFYNTKYNSLTKHKKLLSLFLGMVFVLSSSQLNFLRYIQFTDVSICFPLLLLLIERMVDEKKWILYCAILAFAIISNMYMAFGVCIFLIIWFFFQLESQTTEKMKKFIIFSGSSVLAAIISTGIIVSIYYISKNRIDNSDVSKTIYYATSLVIKAKDFVRQLFIFSPINNPYRTEPNIYVSIICLLLSLFFIFIKIDKRKKIYLLSWMGFMILSFFFGALSLIWHLFNVPNGVYHRFSNMFVFLLLFMLLQVLIHLHEISIKHVILVAVLSLIAYFCTFFTIEKFDSVSSFIVTLFLMVFYILLLVLYCRKSISYNVMIVLIVAFGFIELFCNGFVLINDHYNAYSFADDMITEPFGINAFEDANPDVGERMASTAGYDNAGLYASKNTMSGFISSINGNVLNLMDKLGMGVSDGNVQYTVKGGSPLINLLFNIRYMVSNSTVDISDADKVSSYYGCNLYKTRRLAGLGYMVKDDIDDWDLIDKNCFECQNSFAQLTTGVEDDLFTVINPEVECMDIMKKTIDRDKAYIEKNAYVYNYDSTYGNENDSIQIEFVADEDMDLYVDARSSFDGKFSTLVDGKMLGSDADGFMKSTLHVGNVKKGQKITLVAIVKEDYDKDRYSSVFFRFAKFNEEAYSKVYEILSKNVYDIETMKSDYIKGIIKADEDGIMMTSIQSGVGFDVYVDGNKTECKTIGGALIGVPLTKGEHIVEFKYVGVTPVYGKIISLCGIVVYLILCVISYIKNRKNGNYSNNVISANEA